MKPDHLLKKLCPPLENFSERIDKYPIFLKLYVSCWIFHEIKPCREPKCIFPKIHWTIGPIFKWELAILLGAILTFPDSKLLCKNKTENCYIWNWNSKFAKIKELDLDYLNIKISHNNRSSKESEIIAGR